MASFSAVKTTVARPAMFTAAKARFAGAPMVAKPMIIKARASRFTVSAAASSEVLGKVQGIIAEQLGTDVEKVCTPDAPHHALSHIREAKADLLCTPRLAPMPSSSTSAPILSTP
mmetsp:Transcript_24028/g.75258  ORF Transcript_24028/g.75258 Transcript_24028/m.75258 type:complete len:115 (-) Transcript_24028:400-744(-)